MPKVLNKHKDGTPEGSVYIGRPSQWGNPFVIGKDGTREEVIAKYRKWFLSKPQLVESARVQLAGKDLVCFCAPQACHGDVLLEVANTAGQGAAKTYPEPACSASLVAQPPRDVSELYHELLYAVARKFPGESRHETALRYIRDAEDRACQSGSCKQNT